MAEGNLFCQPICTEIAFIKFQGNYAFKNVVQYIGWIASHAVEIAQIFSQWTSVFLHHNSVSNQDFFEQPIYEWHETLDSLRSWQGMQLTSPPFFEILIALQDEIYK